MYLFILLTVLFSTLLFVVFTLFSIWKVDTFQGIIFNYLTASALSFFFNYTVNVSQLHLIPGLLVSAGFIGLLFIIVFFVMALTTQKAGLAVASVAAKLSLMIPVIFGILYFKESFTIDKLLGILLAIVAILLTNYKDGLERKQHWTWSLLFLPLVLFIGAGIVDTTIKFAQVYIIPPGARELFIMLLFGAAFVIGSIKLAADLILKKTTFRMTNLFGGVLLGIPNFFSIFFLLKALETPGAESSVVFSVCNLSIVILASLAGIMFFKQRLSKVNSIGIVVAAVAIVLLSNIIGLGKIEF